MPSDSIQPSESARALELTAPEYAVLLSGKGAVLSEVIKSALIETLARGALRLEGLPVRTVLRTRDQRLLLVPEGPVDGLPSVLAPVLEAARTARPTYAVDGRKGVTVPAWVDRFRRILAGSGYIKHVVEPALAQKGLLVARKRPLRLGTAWAPTPAGERVTTMARAAATRAKQSLDRDARRAWEKDPQMAAATLAALGSLGALALSDRALIDGLIQLRALTNPAGPAAGSGGAPVAPPESDVTRLDASGADHSGVLPGLDLPGLDLPGLDLPGLDLSGLDLPGLDFSGLDLSGLDLSGLDLSGLDLSGLDLSGFDVSGFDAGSSSYGGDAGGSS